MIVLLGFMGCGKSTLGPLLALCLGRAFLDLDREIEREAGRSVAALFSAEGEEAFRERERRVFQRLAGHFDGVLCVGGGLPAQPGMDGELARAGDCLYLDVPLAALVERLTTPAEAARRPLLAALPADARAAFIRELHARRDPAYRRAGRTLALPAEESALDHLDRLLAALRTP